MSLQAATLLLSSSLAFPDKGSHAQRLWSNGKINIDFINLKELPNALNAER